MLDPACSQDSAKMPSGGEFDDESTAAACFNGVRWCAMHVLCAGSASERCMLSESAASACLSQHTVMPYAERGWICVSGSHVCVYACCSARLRRPGCCILCILWSSGGHGLPKSRFLLHKLFFRFIDYLAVQHVARPARSHLPAAF